jgi:hypothetical protein
MIITQEGLEKIGFKTPQGEFSVLKLDGFELKFVYDVPDLPLFINGIGTDIYTIGKVKLLIKLLGNT